MEHNTHTVKTGEQRAFWKLPSYFISSGLLALHLSGVSDKLILKSFCCINSAELLLCAFHGWKQLTSSVHAFQPLLPVL